MDANDIDLIKLQERLKQLREDTKSRREPFGEESVRAFAKKAGISYTQVARMEGARREQHLKSDAESAPSIVRLYRYLKACGTTLTDFFAKFEQTQPAGLTPHQADLLARARDLILASAEVERRLRDQIEQLEVWLRTAAPAQVKIHGPDHPRTGRGQEPGTGTNARSHTEPPVKRTGTRRR
jgi:transcriptional regulator with XRE-family HTH domain